MASAARRLAISVGASALLTLVLVEVLLQGLSRISPQVENILYPIPYSIPDDLLGRRGNPRYPGHDPKGFRNERLPAQAQIVILGDSQTYGVRSTREDAWPHQLQRLADVETYNMGFPGYGPIQNLLLLEEAVALAPELVIEAIYSGNDPFDAFELVYRAGNLPFLKSQDPDVLRALEEAEEQHADDELQVDVKGILNESQSGEGVLLGAVRQFLSRHLATYRFLGVIRRRAGGLLMDESWEQIKRSALARPDYFQVVETETSRKVFRCGYRLRGIDPRDSRVAEGARICLEALKLMKARCDRDEVKFLVVFIPTAELVFEPRIREAEAHMPEEYDLLLLGEKQFWSRSERFLDKEGIQFVDTLPALQQSLARGEQPYRMDYDGHPNAAGHRAIAQQVFLALNQRAGISPEP